MINNGEPLRVDQLATATRNSEYRELVEMTEAVAQKVMDTIHDTMMIERPTTGGVCMTALAACAGIVQGSMEAEGIVPEITEEALIKMLVENFKTGRKIAFQTAARRAGEKN